MRGQLRGEGEGGRYLWCLVDIYCDNIENISVEIVHCVLVAGAGAGCGGEGVVAVCGDTQGDTAQMLPQ